MHALTLNCVFRCCCAHACRSESTAALETQRKDGDNALVGKTKRSKLQRAKRTAKERGADVTGKALLPGERATVFIIAVMSALCDSAIPALCVSSVFACLPLLLVQSYIHLSIDAPFRTHRLKPRHDGPGHPAQEAHLSGRWASLILGQILAYSRDSVITCTAQKCVRAVWR